MTENKKHSAEAKIEEQKVAPQSEGVVPEAVQKVTELEKKLAEKEQELKEHQEKNLRLYAEFDNYRKRVTAEKDELCKTATVGLLKELLPILDSFERAQVSFEKHKNEKEELHKGLALIHRQFEDTLAKYGIKKIEAKGQKFDPQLHEAIMQQEAAGVEAHTVLEEVQNGYLLHEKLLRPSMVIIAK